MAWLIKPGLIAKLSRSVGLAILFEEFLLMLEQTMEDNREIQDFSQVVIEQQFPTTATKRVGFRVSSQNFETN